MRPRCILALASLGVSLGLAAQQGKKPGAGPELELNLEARDVLRGVPTTFHIILRNIGKEDIRLPEPSLGCASALEGTVWLEEKYTPRLRGTDAAPNRCVALLPYEQDILKRARSWVVLRPGGYLERVASPGRMHYENHGAGTYELFAQYVPPTVTPDERRTLAEAGFVYPTVKLVSKHVVLKKDR
jgi:hypothetical protein